MSSAFLFRARVQRATLAVVAAAILAVSPPAFGCGAFLVGLHSAAIRDDLLVPLGFGGGGFRIGGRLALAAGPGLLDLSADLSPRLLATRFGQGALSLAHGAMLRILLPLPGAHLELGAALVEDSRLHYLESWGNAHAYGFGSQWLGPAIALEAGRVGPADLRFELSHALVGAVGRPPDHRYEKQDPLKRPLYWLAGQDGGGERLSTVITHQAARAGLALRPPTPADGSGRWSTGLDGRFAQDHLFTPPGIEDGYWLDLRDGATTGAFGLHLRPRDLARLGLLALDGGDWQGTQVVSEAWLQAATAPLEADAWEGWSYGRYFWTSPDGDAHTMAGHGGQFAMWFPGADLLTVQVAMPDAELHGSAPGDSYDLVHGLAD